MAQVHGTITTMPNSVKWNRSSFVLVRTTQIDILNGFSDYFAVCSPNGNMILVCGLHMLYFAAGAVCDSDRGKWVAYTLFPFIVPFRQGAWELGSK